MTVVTHSSPSCYLTLRTQVIRLNSGNLGPRVFLLYIYPTTHVSADLVCSDGNRWRWSAVPGMPGVSACVRRSTRSQAAAVSPHLLSALHPSPRTRVCLSIVPRGRTGARHWPPSATDQLLHHTHTKQRTCDRAVCTRSGENRSRHQNSEMSSHLTA